MFDTGIYMLNWASGKKNLISYAASFGHDHYLGKIPENEVRLLLSRFDSISVREKSGVEICKNFGVDALHVLDPTLLLSENKYVALIEENTGININSKFLCTVFLKKDHYDLVKENKALQEFNTLMKVDAIRGPNGFRTVYEWLDAIRRAEYVITDSFHGTVFSIIFKKQFLCIIPKNFNNGMDRIPSLLETLHINKNRICSSIYEVSRYSFNDKIDYSIVYKYLEKEIQKSLFFLKCALNKPLSDKGKIYTIF